MATISPPSIVDHAIDAADPDLAPALAELYPDLPDPFPLCAQTLSFELENTRAAVGNAFQLVITQELQGYYLTASVDSMAGTTDPFMKPEFVIDRLRNIPLAYGLVNPEALEFELDYTNTTKATVSVHARHLKLTKGTLAGPIFNPTIEVADLRPGMRVVVRKIVVAEGVGRMAAPANVAILGRSIPLDLERLPRAQTHTGTQGAAQLSGYVIPSTLANPTRFRVTVVIAASERGSRKALDLPVRACNNILMRLRQVMDILDRADSAGAASAAKIAALSDISHWSSEAPTDEDDDLASGELTLRGETTTIVELLRTELNQLFPDLAYVGVVKGADKSVIGLKVTRHCDAAELRENVKSATKNLIALFGGLRDQL